MGAFDRAAKYAAQTEPIAVVDRLLRDCGHSFTFSSWCESQPPSKPDDDERIPDLVASLDEISVPPRKWLLVIEFQAQTDESKLRVTLEEASNLHSRGRAEQIPPGMPVLTSLIYLVGRCPATLIDMTLQNGKGTRHDALEWNLCDDDANAALDGVSGGTLSWGLLFWVPLMANAEQDSVIRRWKTLVDALPTTEIRENVIGIVRWCSRNWHNATGSGSED